MATVRRQRGAAARAMGRWGDMARPTRRPLPLLAIHR
jgi:hypothetical protein